MPVTLYEALPPKHRQMPRVFIRRLDGDPLPAKLHYLPNPQSAGQAKSGQRLKGLLERLDTRHINPVGDLMADRRGERPRLYSGVEIGSPRDRQFWRVGPVPSGGKPQVIRLVIPVESWAEDLRSPVTWERMWRLTSAAYALSRGHRSCELDILLVPASSALAIANLAKKPSVKLARQCVKEVRGGAAEMFDAMAGILHGISRGERRTGNGPVKFTAYHLLDPSLDFVTNYASRHEEPFPWQRLGEVLGSGRNHWPAWWTLGDLPETVVRSRNGLGRRVQRADTLLVGDAADTAALMGAGRDRGALWLPTTLPTLEPLRKVWFRRPEDWGAGPRPDEYVELISRGPRGGTGRVLLDSVFCEAYAPYAH
jgi:hypothetical protein